MLGFEAHDDGIGINELIVNGETKIVILGSFMLEKSISFSKSAIIMGI